MKWVRLVALVLVVAFVMVAIAGATAPAGQGKGKDLTERFSYGGQQRTYLLHLPPGHDKKKPVPLVVMLHGYTGTGALQAQWTGFSVKADRERFIVVYPDGPNPAGTGRAWSTTFMRQQGPNKDAAFVGEVIRRLRSQFAIDPKRIYVTGMSQGGMVAHAVGCELSSVVAAIAPVCGVIVTIPKSSDPVSVLIINGTADPMVPYYGGGRSGPGGGGRGRRSGGPGIPSVSEAVSTWVAHNGCSPKPKRTKRKGLIKEVYSGGRRGTEVMLCALVGGGHNWPGDAKDNTKSGVVGADVIWEFFERHPKK